MAQAVPVNPDLPSSILIPGVYFKINLAGGAGGLNSPTKRLLLIANKLSSGTAAQDTPIQVTNQTDANTFFGRGSDLARLYAAAAAQIAPGATDIYCVPIVEPSSGAASTHLIIIAGPATSAGSITATICGYSATTAIANGDTATTIASNLWTAIQTLKDIPVNVSASSASSGTITIQYAHKGLVGNDFPVIVNITGASGVTASPGTVVFSSGPASGAGSVALYVGSTTITGTVNNSDSVSTIAATLNTAINAGGFPVTSTVSSGTVTLLYVNDRVVHRINAAVITSTGVTTTVNCGTLGTGAPSLTNALTNLQPQAQYPLWCTSLNDNANTLVTLGSATNLSFHGGSGATTCSLGVIKTHIATYADGYNQKGQQLMWGSTEALAVSGGYQTGTGWNTTSDAGEGRAAQLFQPDSPQQAYELAARAAAFRITQDYKPKNYSGVALITKGTVPLLGPHRAVRSGTADQNSALLTYYMTPVVFDDVSGTNKILRGRTTSPNPDQRLWAWGTLDTLDYIRTDMNGFLSVLFSGKSFKASGQPPRTPNTITTNSIQEAVAERLRSYDSIDFTDDTDNLVKGLTAAQDPIVVNRVNVFLPLRIPVELDQLAGNIALS